MIKPQWKHNYDCNNNCPFKNKSNLFLINMLKANKLGLDIVAHTFNASTQQVVPGIVQGQTGLHTEFQAGQDYMVRFSIKKEKNK